jgi:MoaA/NifB/PqqE/SkfB family radical SAM enzyme
MSAVATPLRFAAGVALKRPFQCLVQVTNRCNMTCSFCDFWPHGVASDKELSLDDYQRVATELSRIGTFLVSIEGGEPFVRRDVIDIVRTFAARHLTVLYTNGWYLDERAAHALFDAGLTQVGVSIDYPQSARHDAKRGIPGTFARACRALQLLRDAAPNRGKQVHMMTVLTADNHLDLDALLELSARLDVGHCVTLLSNKGFRRGKHDALPPPGMTARLLELWQRHPHMRVFRGYLQRIDAFLGSAEDLPRCRAGTQSFNIDHCGNVSPCIEKIDQPVGNIREAPIAELLARMRDSAAVAQCQDCWTLCRGFSQLLGRGGSATAWRDLLVRMRSS